MTGSDNGLAYASAEEERQVTQATEKPTVWYHGWNVVAACVLSVIMARGIPVNSFSLFVHDWSQELQVPISTLQLMMAPLALTCAVIAPIIGGFADKYPARWLYGAGLLGTSLLLLSASAVQSFWQLAAIYALLLPFTLNFSANIVGNPLIARWFVKRRGLALGLAGFGLGLAGMVLPPLIGAIMPDAGWRAIWLGAGVLAAVAVAPAVVLVMRNRPGERDGREYVAAGDSVADGPSHGMAADGALGLRAILKRRNFLIVLAATLPVLGVHGASAQNLAPIAASHGHSQQIAGMLIAIMSLAQVVSTLGMGLISDRFGNRIALAGLGAAAAAGAVILGASGSIWIMGAGATLIGASSGIWTSVAAALAREFGTSFGKAFGAIIIFTPLVAAMPFAIARVFETVGSHAPGLLAIAAIALAGATTALLLRAPASSAS